MSRAGDDAPPTAALAAQDANECRITLIHQIRELADHIERAAPSVADEDMRKQMLGQREYALKVSAKWNQNGSPFAALADDVVRQRDELLAAIGLAMPVIEAHAGPSRKALFYEAIARSQLGTTAAIAAAKGEK